MKKRYRMCVWTKLHGGWMKTQHRELDQHQADLLRDVGENLGIAGPWCDRMREVNGRMVAVERIW